MHQLLYDFLLQLVGCGRGLRAYMIMASDLGLYREVHGGILFFKLSWTFSKSKDVLRGLGTLTPGFFVEKYTYRRQLVHMNILYDSLFKTRLPELRTERCSVLDPLTYLSAILWC